MIVMISGKQGAGKTSLSNMLLHRVKNDFFNVKVLKFASIIDEMHDSIREIQNKYMIPIREGCETKDGLLLQWLGTEWGRENHGENVWVEAMRRKVAYAGGDHDDTLVIIDDCRFENEFDAFPEALRVRLSCPPIVRRERAENWRDKESHPSEVGLDDFAAADKFDLYLNTEKQRIDSCVDLIDAQLKKNSWREKRDA